MKTYFDSLNPSKITDNKTFWKNIQPLFSEKRKVANKNTLVDRKNRIISEDSLVSEETNLLFQNAMKSLEINENFYIEDETNEYTDRAEKVVYEYGNHTRLLLIKTKLKSLLHFCLIKLP